MKLPFYANCDNPDKGLSFVASDTRVYTKEGFQWKMLIEDELRYLLENHHVSHSLYFRAKCSVNVLWILKDGI